MGLKNANESFRLTRHMPKPWLSWEHLWVVTRRTIWTAFWSRCKPWTKSSPTFHHPYRTCASLDYGQWLWVRPDDMTPDGIKGRGKVTPQTLECLVNDERPPSRRRRRTTRSQKGGVLPLLALIAPALGCRWKSSSLRRCRRSRGIRD